MSNTTIEKKKSKVFVEGPIPSQLIAKSVDNHASKTGIGGHNIFLGQVRADKLSDGTVTGIAYTAYEDMAEKQFARIREAAFEQFDIECMHIKHSLGLVKAGEVCLFVFVSSGHRDAAYKASRFIVEQIKAEVPIFGKEVLDNDGHQWKENQ